MIWISWYGVMVKWCNYFCVIFIISQWCCMVMFQWCRSTIMVLNVLIYFNGSMLQWFLVALSLMVIWWNDVSQIWWNDEVANIIMVDFLWDLIVSWFIRSYQDLLGLIKHTNACNTIDNGEDNICYLRMEWILIISLVFGLVAFLSFPIAKWYNGEIVFDGGVMMVWRLWLLTFIYPLLSGVFKTSKCWY